MPGEQVRTRDAPAFMLRPGVVIPDWSCVDAEPARRALARIVQTSDRARSWSNLPAADDRVWQAVLAEFVAGRLELTAARIARRASLAEDFASAALARLATRDLVVLSSDGRAVRAAYPFSATDVGYRVRLGSRQVFALCAVDALGLGAMHGADSVISATCRHCAAPIEAMTGRKGATLDSFAPRQALVWCGLAEAGGCAATSGCTVKTFFCRPAHLDAWRRTVGGKGEGIALSMAEGHMVGCAIFAPMCRPASDA
ncbi:MAG TPA: organomercurial lyase [Alphaproteobacteria bacterium]|nr:organomercurial lyase [Alphaproteobacteria bacterium]